MAQAKKAPQTGLARTVKKVSVGARISDAVLTVVFAVWAWHVGPASAFWFWTLVSSAAFCAVAVFVSPIEIIHRWMHGRIFAAKAPRQQ